jgi:hypothetical protein
MRISCRAASPSADSTLPSRSLHHAAAIDDAPQAYVEGIDHGGNGGQQEHRRHGQLDDTADIGKVGIHGRRQGPLREDQHQTRYLAGREEAG